METRRYTETNIPKETERQKEWQRNRLRLNQIESNLG